MNVNMEFEVMTHKLVENIRSITKAKYDLIIIDNNSMTKEDYGADVYVRNKENIGISKSWNLGMRIVQTDYITIINNDIAVYGDWLTEMLNVFKIDEKCGVSCCMRVSDIKERKQIRNPKFFKGVNGACFTLSKETIKTVGFFDEQFSPCFFEDLDYWNRIKQEKLKCIVCRDGIMKHIGRKTCKLLPDMDGIFLRNKEKYEVKWGKK